MRRRLALISVAFLVCLIALPHSALADSHPNRSNKGGEQLAPHPLLITIAVPTQSIPELGQIRGEKCRWARVTVYLNNSVGQHLARYVERIDWCWTTFEVTSTSWVRYGEGSVRWDFLGHIDGWDRGGPNYSYYTAYTKGHFEGCIYPIFTCILYQEWYPWIQMNVTDTGAWDFTWGS
jgi:hypothetical protein